VLSELGKRLRRLMVEPREDRSELPEVADIRSALAQFPSSTDCEAPDVTEQPVFLLATGWRTGSTLMQRILMTDPRLLLWGEPLGRMALIPRVTEAVCALCQEWPKPDHWIDHHEGELPTSWVANLFPPLSDLRCGLRQWLNHWLGAPARERGFQRWGLKEVRLAAADAYVLRWLFPGARFVILVRHPCDAYRSAIRSFPQLRLWYRWPDRAVDSIEAYARHWNRLARSWLDLPEDFGHTVLKYEDVVQGEVDFRAMERLLGLKLEESKRQRPRALAP
jgi:hypothetical protein